LFSCYPECNEGMAGVIGSVNNEDEMGGKWR